MKGCVLLLQRMSFFQSCKNFALLKPQVKTFLKKECEPRLTPLEKRLKNLKKLLLGRETATQDHGDITPVASDEFNDREFKTLYRNLAALYHLDKSRSEREKKVFSPPHERNK